MRFRRVEIEPGRRVLGGIYYTEPSGESYHLFIDPGGFEELELQRDPSPADWVARTLWDRSSYGTVAALIPPGFEAEARVAYPPHVPEGAPKHEPLFRVLERHTTTPNDVWFSLWEGYGGFDQTPPERVQAPPVSPIRAYFLYRGPLSAWKEMTPSPVGHVPDLVWPQDRAWFLGTDTDIDWAFLGASEACISDLESDPSRGVVRVTSNDPLGPVAPGHPPH